MDSFAPTPGNLLEQQVCVGIPSEGGGRARAGRFCFPPSQAWIAAPHFGHWVGVSWPAAWGAWLATHPQTCNRLTLLLEPPLSQGHWMRPSAWLRTSSECIFLPSAFPLFPSEASDQPGRGCAIPQAVGSTAQPQGRANVMHMPTVIMRVGQPHAN